MKGKRKVTFLIIAALALLMAAAIVLINRQGIFQEGNPIPVIAGICHIEFNHEPYAQIKDEPATYIARAGRHEELFALIEKTYGVAYKRTNGDRYVFEGGGKTVELATRNYTQSFRIWEVVGGIPP